MGGVGDVSMRTTLSDERRSASFPVLVVHSVQSLLSELSASKMAYDVLLQG